MEPESRIELPTSSLPRKRSTTELPRHHVFMVGREGFEPSKATPSDLQSDPFDHSGISPLQITWSWQWDLNPQPADYKSAALPIELCQH